MQASTGSTGEERRSARRMTSQPASKPPSRPPMCPPIETLRPGNRNGNSRLMRIVGPRPDCHGSMPRARRNITPAPISPNTAPDAPTV